ncbi:DHHA1 domain-containing protein [Nitrosomonas aestuarii]|uniref:DHHA1 domain-containing protein n=1 Tax=Nitrosomonas aestuarii TaxID=52441 RepID=UPI000D3171B9|nr:DHH family phosphoesterase [Nitrosomonas aestuarii]PTN12291.1 DHH family putative phosphoesterase [Nitrosomonas aestuarii]
MNYIDVFNGDADGICALIQLRKAHPQDAQLITGVKRDIQLLKNVEATPNDHISVLDISFEKNRADIQRLLHQGASIEYYDHHKSGTLVSHPKLRTYIDDQSSAICTGLLVDRKIDGQFRAWALVAAFGDNFNAAAMTLGESSGFDRESLCTLQKLGVYINYNSYGEHLSDLFYHPDALYRHLLPFTSPFDFINEKKEIYNTLAEGYANDMAAAKSTPYLHQSTRSAIVLFDNEKWARRVSGVYINALANQHPDRAHAVITQNTDKTYKISIRSPLNKTEIHADKLASQFQTGGGRKSAAGINALPDEQLNPFIDTFKVYFS